jgi:hypothetical protein
MKYAVKMGSGAMIFIPGFIKIASGIQNLIRGIYRQHNVLISQFLFFQTKGSSVYNGTIYANFNNTIAFDSLKLAEMF